MWTLSHCLWRYEEGMCWLVPSGPWLEGTSLQRPPEFTSPLSVYMSPLPLGRFSPFQFPLSDPGTPHPCQDSRSNHICQVLFCPGRRQGQVTGARTPSLQQPPFSYAQKVRSDPDKQCAALQWNTRTLSNLVQAQTDVTQHLGRPDRCGHIRRAAGLAVGFEGCVSTWESVKIPVS